jgi:hypothetical protein
MTDPTQAPERVYGFYWVRWEKDGNWEVSYYGSPPNRYGEGWYRIGDEFLHAVDPEVINGPAKPPME